MGGRIDFVSTNGDKRITVGKILTVLVEVMMITGAAGGETNLSLISVVNGEDLSGWTVPGKATWSVQDGVLVGMGGMGHIYAEVIASDIELKACFGSPSRGQ